MDTTALNRREIEALIVKRAWSHPEFREEFLADPKATIEKYGGAKLPAELNIVALAEDDKTIHFVIPPKPANSDEISEEDLEKVAGGIDIVVLPFILAAGLVTGLVVVGGAAAGTQANHGW